jgi:hypothetical protein
VTDINDLDQYLGRYVTLTDPDGESAAGFLVRIHDAVDYIPHPVRTVMLDWGQGWRIGEDTDVDVLPGAPEGQQPPQVLSGIDILHEFAHDGGCPDMNCRVRARVQLRELRRWRMKQEDAYWTYKYVRRARAHRDDPDAVAHLIERAVRECAPMRVVDHLRIIAERAHKAASEGS